MTNKLPSLGDKQDVRIGGQTEGPYWETSSVHFLRDKQVFLIGGLAGCPYWGTKRLHLLEDKYIVLFWETNRLPLTAINNSEACHRLKWDVIKDQIRGFSVKYSVTKKRNSEKKLSDLEIKIDELESYIDKHPYDTKANEDLCTLKQERDKILSEKTNGARIRCRVRWAEEGEKSTRYFLNLEKRNYNSKIVNKIITDDDTEVTDPEKIREELKIFYENLYSSKVDKAYSLENQQFFSNNSPKLSEENKMEISGVITEKELSESLKSTSSGKAPGSDGFTVNFYKFFWADIKKYLLDSINEAFEEGEMSISQKHGILTLLPKKDKDLIRIKNWRPITLLNQDYKLVAKCIANRIKKHLNLLIHSDQTGFLKGRYIGENINKILALMDICDEQNIPAILIAIDFEKAFDSLEWSFIDKTLEFFNFGESIQKWVKTLYKNSNGCVINNGWSSGNFVLGRGVRQGCPLSPYLFLLAAEILSISIRSDDSIPGIHLNGKTHKISQYADDTTLVQRFDRNGINNTLTIFSDFQKISGLKVNFDKTEIFPIGQIKNSMHPLYSDREVKWSPHGIKVLGIHILHSKQEMVEKNLNPVLNKLSSITKLWRQRDLTLYGKTTILKSLLASQLVYPLSVIPSPPKKFYKEIEKILFNFVWNGKPDKIKRNVLYGEKCDGGLKLTNIECQDKALKIAWIKRLCSYDTDDVSWKDLIKSMLPTGDIIIFEGNLSDKDVVNITKNVKSSFWSDVLKHWSAMTYKEPAGTQEILKQRIWYNSFIRIENKPVFWKKWLDAGIKCIEDLITENRFLTFEEFLQRYNIQTNFLQFHSIVRAIPRNWKGILNNVVNNNQTVKTSMFNVITTCDKPSQIAYKKIIGTITVSPDHLLEKWSNELHEDIDKEFMYNCFSKLYASTSMTKLRSFQFRLLHRIIGINTKLYKWGITDSDKCSFCNENEETFVHLFYNCNHVLPFWTKVKKLHG